MKKIWIYWISKCHVKWTIVYHQVGCWLAITSHLKIVPLVTSQVGVWWYQTGCMMPRSAVGTVHWKGWLADLSIALINDLHMYINVSLMGSSSFTKFSQMTWRLQIKCSRIIEWWWIIECNRRVLNHNQSHVSVLLTHNTFPQTFVLIVVTNAMDQWIESIAIFKAWTWKADQL